MFPGEFGYNLLPVAMLSVIAKTYSYTIKDGVMIITYRGHRYTVSSYGEFNIIIEMIR